MKWLIATCVALIFIINPVYANILVSGDSNITNPLTGSYSQPIDAGNQQFFTNILGAGTTVVLLDNSIVSGSVSYSVSDINTHYNSLTGVSSSIFSGTVTAAQLSGADLFVVVLPDDDFTALEIDAMAAFLAGGGSIFFLGENNNFSLENASINNALTDLGSSLVIVNDLFDSGFHTATGAQIASDPYTTGVTTFTYAAPSEVSVVSGGTPLFYGTDEATVFLAYEAVETEILVSVDIKPGSCPNPFNGKSKGSVPVGIVGTADFDVTTIDPSTIELTAPSGVVVPALEEWEIKDSTQPDGDNTDCFTCFDADDPLNFNCDLWDATAIPPGPGTDGVLDSYCGDGNPDLVVKFDMQELAAAIGAADREDCVELLLTGLTQDGILIYGSDKVVIKTKLKD